MNDSFSLWLKPVGQAEEVLSKIANDLAIKHEAPMFVPHITLLGDLVVTEAEAIDQTRQMAARLSPLTLETTAVEISTTYFQCVLARIKTIPALMTAYTMAQDVFQTDKEVFYMPHLSLLYGNFEMQKRFEIAENINLPKLVFEIKVLTLVTSGPDPTQWQTIAEIPFTQ